jgi:hypothetical protein
MRSSSSRQRPVVHLSMGRHDDQCVEVDDFAHRCQLLAHEDGQHVAMVKFDVLARRGNRWHAGVEYRRWGQLWTKPEPGQATLRWAPTFPRLET